MASPFQDPYFGPPPPRKAAVSLPVQDLFRFHSVYGRINVSIPLSTDILAGVASAADPAKLQAATERLTRFGAANAADAATASNAASSASPASFRGLSSSNKTTAAALSFQNALDSTQDPASGLSVLSAVPPGLATAAARAIQSKTGPVSKVGTAIGQTPSALSPAQKFEAFVLQSFIELMLPKEAENVYGSGTAGGYWKSMMAEQMAVQIARTGKTGVADYIDKAKAGPSPVAPAQIYQSASPLTAHLSKLPYDGDRN